MEVNDNNYNELVLNGDKPVFIDFYSPSCGPCQELKLFLDENLIEYGREKEVLILTCNVSQNPKLAEKFKIRSVPFTIGVTKDKSFKYPELGMQEAHYYFNIIDKLSGKKKKFFGLF